MPIEIRETKTEEDRPKPVAEPEVESALRREIELQKLKEETDAMEAEVKRQEDLVRRREELKARMTLGGKSEAGQKAKEETEEEKTDKEAAEILKMYDSQETA